MSKQSCKAVFEEMGFSTDDPWVPGAVAYSVGRTYGLLMRRLSRSYQRYGLTAPSFNLLMLLKHGLDPKRMSQQEIGKRLVVSPSDMTGLIDRLEKKGLVKRVPGKDRREKLLRISPQGAKLLDELWPHHTEAVEKSCGGLTKEEAGELVKLLGKLRSQCG